MPVRVSQPSRLEGEGGDGDQQELVAAHRIRRTHKQPRVTSQSVVSPSSRRLAAPVREDGGGALFMDRSHMPGWQGSDRRSRLPPDWESKIRPRILRRDGHRCTARDQDGDRCPERATDVDHVRRGDIHEDWNLVAICTWHHSRKSSREGAQAAARKKAAANRKFRRSETHPGLL